MIRSPPPVSWPRSPNFKMFRFPNEDGNTSQVSNIKVKNDLKLV